MKSLQGKITGDQIKIYIVAKLLMEAPISNIDSSQKNFNFVVFKVQLPGYTGGVYNNPLYIQLG